LSQLRSQQLQQSLNVLILLFALQRVQDIANLLPEALEPRRASMRAPYKAMASGLLELLPIAKH
jgi:hypothetical protein